MGQLTWRAEMAFHVLSLSLSLRHDDASLFLRGWGVSEDIISFTVTFPAYFQSFADAALLRLQVRYPQTSFLLSEGKFEVVPAAHVRCEVLHRDILHTIYAERIFAETLPMRQALVAAVTAR